MTKKQLEILLAELKGEVRELKVLVNGLECGMDTKLSLGDAKMRDYIVRNNYIGKLTDKNIIADFKKEIEKKFEDNFKSIETKILNYQFVIDDKEKHVYNRNILFEFYSVLVDYEYKQIVVDTYNKKGDK
jgi:hypothetical protein